MATPRQIPTLLLLRYTLIVATAYLLLVEGRFGIPPIAVCIVIAAALASNVALGLLPAAATASKLATGAIVLADTVWVTIVLLASGRFNADFFFLYFFVLLLAAMGESLALVALGAIVVCVAYLYVLSATGGTWTLWNSPSIIRLPFLFTAAAFYGHLIQRMRHEVQHAKDAEALAQTRTELLATVSHEIRNPVNGMLGWSELLLDTELTADQREYVNGVRRAGHSLVAIVNDVLDIAKIEAGKLAFEQVEFSPADAIEEVTKLMAEAAQRKGLELIYRVDPEVPPIIEGDPLRLRQIVTNLLGNAVKFTAKGEIVVHARVAGRDATSILLRVEVTDTGVGIPREQQERIFNAFEQADGTTARHYGGTGLGLSISKRLVAAMSGAIGVASRTGEGSAYWFTARFRVPAGIEAAGDHGAPNAAEQPPPSVPAPLVGARVLVVDDNATLRAVLDAEMREWGAASTAVADGTTALAMLRAAAAVGASYRVVLIDADLPGGGGRTLVEAIQDDGALAGLRVVLLMPIGACRDEAPVVAILRKPVAPARLRECLIGVLEVSPTAAHTHASDPQPHEQCRVSRDPKALVA
jgi:signal transduction histidine kinase